jgi:hypothetical protein
LAVLPRERDAFVDCPFHFLIAPAVGARVAAWFKPAADQRSG